MTAVLGQLLDDQTRCIHYHSEFDIIAIRFKCCGSYYACFSCHDELESHESRRWAEAEFHETAILCGKCRSEITIQQYLDAAFICPSCHSPFNEGCRLHHHLYFEVPVGGTL